MRLAPLLAFAETGSGLVYSSLAAILRSGLVAVNEEKNATDLVVELVAITFENRDSTDWGGKSRSGDKCTTSSLLLLRLFTNIDTASASFT